MKKEKNQSPLEKKLILQILSVAAAIILWFAIVYTEDPSITTIVNNISLNASGEKILLDNGLVFADRSKIPGISVEVRGKRSDVKSVLNSITANIDLSNITEPGEYLCDLSFEVPNPSVMITKKKTSSVTVNIEKAVSKDIPVFIRQSGTDKNKDYLIKSTPDKETVKVTGTQGDVSRIKEALLTIDVSEISGDSSEEYEVSLADTNHNILTLQNPVTVDRKSITVDNKLYLRKSADIALDPSLDLSGYQVTVKSFSKESVEIGVEADDYDTVDTVYADFINGISENVTGKYQMKLIIPDSIYCPSAEDELIMTADIEKIVTEILSIDITAENAPQGFSVSINPPSVSAELTGAQSKMQDVKAKVNLSGLSTGTYDLPVVFVTDNTDVTVSTSATVSVTIQ